MKDKKWKQGCYLKDKKIYDHNQDLHRDIVLSFICILKIGQLNPGSVSTTIVESKFSTAESNFSSFLHRLA